MRVLVCDDEPLARDRMRRMLERIPATLCVGEAENGQELLERVPSVYPDIILLDIRMPGMDGLQAASRLSESDSPPAIIFCTAYDEHAIAAFKVNAVDYLLKPVRQEDLEKALSKAGRVNKAQMLAVRRETGVAQPEQANAKEREYISVRSRKGIDLIAVADVRYFLADQKYVTVRHSQGETLLDETLKELETEFGDRFLRVHRNALVALSYIEALEHKGNQFYLRIQGVEERLAVSRRHASSVKKLLQSL
ncbi:response regulator transcription factor [Ketobacter sp. MCCC 1A13808]|uniref:LytR/AlgR family response regulator transcription factor n=1 Tax=Ketobacter sp. MCCC 1A13808 TaxID=2602738 RepID=UPI000F186C3A|nr:LytTR family DNA-binding domain-containing protein [Ketobacter sp. MCCC 1A13808]MVF14057.1 response regulator transcription factor [Ketobacter sp. MCCC 1A13808]RLP55172.1 MAG: DNA-binding response regulator [Ketobacter sp.]